MSLVTVEDFLESREARESNLTEENEEDVQRALDEAEATLELELGYKVADDTTSVTIYGRGDDFIYPSHRIREITSLTYGGGTLGTSDYYVGDSGFSLWRGLRGSTRPWYADQPVVITGTFGYDPGYVPDASDDLEEERDPDPQYRLAQKYVRMLTARMLDSSSEDGNIPANVSTYTAEGASFQFTDDSDLKKLLDRIGTHPSKKVSLFTISTTRGDMEDTDAIWEQLQRTK